MSSTAQRETPESKTSSTSGGDEKTSANDGSATSGHGGKASWNRSSTATSDQPYSHSVGNGSETETVTRIILKNEPVIRRLSILYLQVIITFLIGAAIYFTSVQNPEIYDVDKETLKYVNRAINATILLTIPLVLGCIGAIARLLISGLAIIDHKALIFASGLISSFSWVGIKSGVLMKIVAPHLPTDFAATSANGSTFESEFYTMMLVAIIVGTFSSNLYIFVNEKIERILAQSKEDPKPSNSGV